jgi:gas vesicle protein
MTTNGESRFSYLLMGLGLGAVGGLMAALLVRKETREVIRERTGKSLEYLNLQAAKLRQSADVIVQQGKKLIACKASDSVNHSTEAEKQAYQENRRENLGGEDLDGNARQIWINEHPRSL